MMRRYKNAQTGAVIATKSIISAPGWALVAEDAPTAEPTPKPEKKPAKKGKKEK